MFHHVFLQALALVTCVVTHHTTVRLFATVNSFVYLQIIRFNRGEAALSTTMKSLASVFRHVILQSTCSNTGVVTLGALEFVHACVSLHVSPKMA